jgi:glutaredoxin
MFEQVDFTKVPGHTSVGKLQLMALSTCGFCKRGMDYLRQQGITYEYAYLDQVDAEVKVASKDEFRTKFGINLSYPSLVKDGESYTLGYIQRYWDEFLGIAPVEVVEAAPHE